jgi:hypothetical protein
VESFYYLRDADLSHYLDLKHQANYEGYVDLTYQCESTVSAVDLIWDVAPLCRLTGEDEKRAVLQGTLSSEPIREQFFTLYQEFSSATGFEERCRLLADLFRLQIIFAGLLYY